MIVMAKKIHRGLASVKVVQGTEKEKKLAMSLNFSFRYIDDVLSLNNLQFKDSLCTN